MVILFILMKYIKKFRGTILFSISFILYAIIFILDSPSMSTTGFIVNCIPIALLRGLAGLSLGGGTYYLYTRVGNFIKKTNCKILSIVEIITIVLLFRLMVFRSSSYLNFAVPVLSGILVLFMFSENLGIMSKVFSLRIWNYLSEISYSFYVMQSFCSNFFTCICPNVIQPYVTFWYLVLNLAVAIVVHELVEKPVYRLLKSKLMNS